MTKLTTTKNRAGVSWRTMTVCAAALVAITGVWPGGAGAQLPPNASSSTGFPAEQGFPRFKDAAAAAGIEFVLDAADPERRYTIEGNSAGVLLIDYDRDGWLDIYFVNGSTPSRLVRKEPSRGNRLYRNQRNGTFADVTAKAGVQGNGRWGMGGCVADVDNNGYDDIFVTNYGPNVLYLNNGNGTFRDSSAESGAAGGERWHSGCGFGDYDSDGDVDLYVSRYAKYDFDDVRSKPPYSTFKPGVAMGVPGPRRYQADAHMFLENVGKGTFVDATARLGVVPAGGGYGFAVVWGDYDNDGDADIFVANDLTPNFLFMNTGAKGFVEEGRYRGVAVNMVGRVQASMGADAADFDNDGDLDIVVTNYASEYHAIYRNESAGLFRDVSQQLRLVVSRDMGWGVQFADLNLDGLQDLAIAHGHLDSLMERPLGRAGGMPTMPNVRATTAGLRQWSNVRRNTGKAFDLIVPGRLGELFREPTVGRGLAVGDLNNDGQLDLVMSNQNERASLFMNEGVPGNWLMVAPRGTRSNRSAIGARVTLTGRSPQMREIKGGFSYLSQGDPRAHFGLGGASGPQDVEIRWPSGRVQVEKGLAPNRIHVIRER